MKWIPERRPSNAEVDRLVKRVNADFTREMDMELIRRVIEGMEEAAKAKGWIIISDPVEVV